MEAGDSSDGDDETLPFSWRFVCFTGAVCMSGTLHPTPHTPHLAPCTLRHTIYTPNFTPCAVPYTLHDKTGTLFSTPSCTLRTTPYTLHCVRTHKHLPYGVPQTPRARARAKSRGAPSARHLWFWKKRCGRCVSLSRVLSVYVSVHEWLCMCTCTCTCMCMLFSPSVLCVCACACLCVCVCVYVCSAGVSRAICPYAA